VIIRYFASNLLRALFIADNRPQSTAHSQPNPELKFNP